MAMQINQAAPLAEQVSSNKEMKDHVLSVYLASSENRPTLLQRVPYDVFKYILSFVSFQDVDSLQRASIGGYKLIHPAKWKKDPNTQKSSQVVPKIEKRQEQLGDLLFYMHQHYTQDVDVSFPTARLIAKSDRTSQKMRKKLEQVYTDQLNNIFIDSFKKQNKALRAEKFSLRGDAIKEFTIFTSSLTEKEKSFFTRPILPPVMLFDEKKFFAILPKEAEEFTWFRFRQSVEMIRMPFTSLRVLKLIEESTPDLDWPNHLKNVLDTLSRSLRELVILTKTKSLVHTNLEGLNMQLESLRIYYDNKRYDEDLSGPVKQLLQGSQNHLEKVTLVGKSGNFSSLDLNDLSFPRLKIIRFSFPRGDDSNKQLITSLCEKSSDTLEELSLRSYPEYNELERLPFKALSELRVLFKRNENQEYPDLTSEKEIVVSTWQDAVRKDIAPEYKILTSDE